MKIAMGAQYRIKSSLLELQKRKGDRLLTNASDI